MQYNLFYVGCSNVAYFIKLNKKKLSLGTSRSIEFIFYRSVARSTKIIFN